MKNRSLQLNSYHKISDVVADPVKRIKTGIHEIDYIYGISEKTKDGKYSHSWGLPVGKISVWIAPGGTGKSRALVEVCKSVSTVKIAPGSSYTALYFQNETTLGEFKAMACAGGLPMNVDNFIVSDANTLSGQLRVINELTDKGQCPQLIVVDSISKMPEFQGGLEKGVNTVIYGPDGEDGYKDVVTRIGSHVIFVSQVNKSGQARGSSVFNHAVDQEFFVNKLKKDDSKFVITCPEKNRHAKTGTECLWQHTDDCAKCIGETRHADMKWQLTHGNRKVIKVSQVPVRSVGSTVPGPVIFRPRKSLLAKWVSYLEPFQFGVAGRGKDPWSGYSPK